MQNIKVNIRYILAKSLVLCLVLLPFVSFAQTIDTETPDTNWFTDVTAKVGLIIPTSALVPNPNALSLTMISVDINNDDYPDLIVLSGLHTDHGWQIFLNEQRPGSTDPTDRIFVNNTTASGLNIPGVYKDLAGAGDFDNDGNVDIVVNCWYLNLDQVTCQSNPDSGKSRLRIFWGNGDGTFTLDDSAGNPKSGLEALGPLSGSGLPALDYDRDGNLDFFAASHINNWCQQVAEPAHLMHNNGNRTFTDRAKQAGINVSQPDPAKPWDTPPPARALYGANMSDWNNDCYPDIFTCPYEATGYPSTANHCLYNYGTYSAYAPCNADTQNTRGYGNLYRNNGDGTFTDVGVSANYDTHFAWSTQGIVPWAAMPADYNNDGNMDYLVLEVHGANYDTVSPWNKPNAEPGDGRTCIFTNQGPAKNYKLLPEVSRIRRSAPINTSHGDHFGFWSDYNNDGWQDLMIGDAVYAGTPDNQRMFFELQDTTLHNFNDITKALGYCTNSSINYKIRRVGGILPVDYDLDGDDDIIKLPYSWPGDSILVLRNNVGNKNNHITIKLVAPIGVNKSCIGARITVKAGNIKQMKDIMGDQGQWTNEYPFIQNFGLGKRTMIDTIDVRWPDANCTHTIVTNVPVNQFIKIDGDGIVTAKVVDTPTGFTLFPNPAVGNTITLKFNRSKLNPLIQIFNSIGQVMGKYQPGISSSSFTYIIPINTLVAGTYFINVAGTDGQKSTTLPFIKLEANK